jgi:hypothetical protein
MLVFLESYILVMRIPDFFNKGYYINLDRRFDRREQFEGEMAKHDLTNFFERVSAFDGAHETEWNRKHYYCGWTFHELLKKAYQDGHERIVIFEDDAIFYKDGKSHVESALDQLQNVVDWDLIYFGGHVIGNPNKKISDNLIQPNIVLTAHAVGYSRKGIEKLLGYEPFKDSALDGWIGDRPHIKKYLVWPMSVIQRGDTTSDLDATKWTPTTEFWKNSYDRVELC